MTVSVSITQVLNYENLSLNPHSNLEVHWVTLDRSTLLRPTYLAELL